MLSGVIHSGKWSYSKWLVVFFSVVSGVLP